MSWHHTRIDPDKTTKPIRIEGKWKDQKFYCTAGQIVKAVRGNAGANWSSRKNRYGNVDGKTMTSAVVLLLDSIFPLYSPPLFGIARAMNKDQVIEWVFDYQFHVVTLNSENSTTRINGGLRRGVNPKKFVPTFLGSGNERS